MCRLTWSSSSLAVLTRGPRTQRLQPNHVIFVSKSSRRINYTQETAEPLGVSPPEAVDLLLIQYVTEPGDSCGEINPLFLARRRRTLDHSLVAGGAQRQSLQACLPDGHTAQCLFSACSP